MDWACTLKSEFMNQYVYRFTSGINNGTHSLCAYSLTACEPASLLVGRSFETSTVPNLKFPNNDSACERSYCQLRTSRTLSLFNDVPLRTRRVQKSLYKVNGESALLVLNGTLLNSDNAPLVLSRRYGTVNRGDFGQIFTIFINIFIMINLNSRFHMGISKYHVRATHIIHTQL